MPALDWVEQAQKQANQSSEFRGLGSMDTSVCIQSGKHACSVRFNAFEVESIDTVDQDSIDDQEIVIAMSTREWNAYLYNRRMKRAPNLLHLDAERGIVKTKNAMAQLNFERILNSIQAFIDLGAKSRA